jgi:membrane-associated phospholipid phosphatase
MMQLLYWFESIRAPWLDEVMSVVTYLGSEAVFLAVALFVFWCVDKRRGYYLMTVGCLGTLVSQWLKIVFRVPRPWAKDPNFTIVESARAGAGDYSFPSGHTQCAAGYLGGVARFTEYTWLRIVCVLLVILTAVSRLYLGVHTPLDVGASLAISAVLVLTLYPLVESTLWFPSRMYMILGGMTVLGVAFVAFMELFPFPAEADADALAAAMKNAYALAGAATGLLAAYFFDSRLVHFPTRAPWWGQIIKFVVGLGLLAAVGVLIKEPLSTLCGGRPIATGLECFLLVLLAGCVWPLTFRFFFKFAK